MAKVEQQPTPANKQDVAFGLGDLIPAGRELLEQNRRDLAPGPYKSEAETLDKALPNRSTEPKTFTDGATQYTIQRTDKGYQINLETQAGDYTVQLGGGGKVLGAEFTNKNDPSDKRPIAEEDVKRMIEGAARAATAPSPGATPETPPKGDAPSPF